MTLHTQRKGYEMPHFTPTKPTGLLAIIVLTASLLLCEAIAIPNQAEAKNWLTIGATADRTGFQLQLGALKTFSNRTAGYIPVSIGSGQTTIAPAIWLTLKHKDPFTIGFTVAPAIDILSIPEDTDSKLTYLSAATGLGCAYNNRLGLGLFVYTGYRATETPLPRLYIHTGLLLRLD